MNKCQIHDLMYDDIKEIKTDVKLLLADKYRKEGQKNILKSLWMFFIGFFK